MQRYLILCLFLLAFGFAPSSWAEIRLGVFTGNLTSGNGQNYDPGHGARLFMAYRDLADVFLIQEFNYGDNSDESVRGWVDRTFGKDWHYYREPADEQASDGYHIPNGIVSRYPIVASGSTRDPQVGDRGFAWAKLKLPNGKSALVMSLHLSHGSGTKREKEAEALMKFIDEMVAKGEIKEDDYMALGGDFNLQNHNEKMLEILSRRFVVTRRPVDTKGNGNTSTNRSKPYDVILANHALDQYLQPIEIPGNGTFTEGFVHDDRCTIISQLSPLMGNESTAPNMQHMPVIEKFVAPN